MTAVAAEGGRARHARARPLRGVLTAAIVGIAAAAAAAAALTARPSTATAALLLAAALVPLVTTTVVALMIVFGVPLTPFSAYLSLSLTLFVAGGTAGSVAQVLPEGLAWVERLTIVVSVFGFFPVGYFFPTGRAVPGWSRRLVPAWLALGVFTLSFPWDPFPDAALVVLAAAGAALIGTVVACQVVRYRRASSTIERQQQKWVMLALFLIAAMMLAIIALPAGSVGRDPVLTVLFGLLWPIASTVLPVTIGFAMLHYRLFDVDLVIGRGIVYAAATAFVLVSYLLVVGAVGLVWPTGTPVVLPVAATAVAALGLAPVHRFVRRRVNRWLYGHRDDPSVVLTRLARDLGRDGALHAVLDRVSTALAAALRAAAVETRAVDGSSALVGARSGAPRAETPLSADGEVIGTITVWPHEGERLTAGDERMLREIGDAAGIAVRAALADLRLQRSREALVVAREDERRRLHRELHDGVGPTLASVAQRIRRARDLAPRQPGTAHALLASAGEGIEHAMNEVRAIVAGLRPPALESLGLAEALRAAWADAERPVIRVRGDPGTLSPAAEIAAYRIAMEAVGNAARHSGARTCHVTLERSGAELRMRIEDDGGGGARSTPGGNGLRTMRERAEGLGGRVTLRDGHPGTVVELVLPLPDPEGSRP
ncbi:sensor histidine kinase [Microbacterium sp. No. 7]|uniref:sensor histidine kinase n=1 Tax=Microbacterium sp. No. 7 TaxID=1714373 RepID=UPI0006D0E17E|nr:GAF domain-containing sensor histidine kinase [Microbacterium sp. No. 7]ALJ20431.1 hypothetical protein AOA12_11150 [Microbacterium sp. No. 7]